MQDRARGQSKIRRRDDANITRHENTGTEAVLQRLRELDEEWDVERVLQANAGTIALVGVTLGFGVDQRFFLLPAVVFSFFLQHALQGWCPPIPVFRRMGVRTAREIARERYALKALRGDFDDLGEASDAAPADRVRAVLRAIDA